jgi:uncharacterized protein (DUF433 family)
MNGTALTSLLSSRGQPQPVSPPQVQEQALPELVRPMRGGWPQPDSHWAISNAWYLQRKLAASNDSIRQAVEMGVRVMHGNPVFRGTRVPIYTIVEELADGTTLSEVLDGYPSLTLDQIQHGLDFAASLLRIYDDQIPD